MDFACEGLNEDQQRKVISAFYDYRHSKRDMRARSNFYDALTFNGVKESDAEAICESEDSNEASL